MCTLPLCINIICTSSHTTLNSPMIGSFSSCHTVGLADRGIRVFYYWTAKRTRTIPTPALTQYAQRNGSAINPLSRRGVRGPAAKPCLKPEVGRVLHHHSFKQGASAGSFSSALLLDSSADWLYDAADDERQIMRRADGWGQVPHRVPPLPLWAFKCSGGGLWCVVLWVPQGD